MTEDYGSLKEQRDRLEQGAPTNGLLNRTNRINELLGEHEGKLRDFLDRIRGSNVKHLEHAPEPIPNGLPGMMDQIERRLNSSLKLLQDLIEVF